VDNECQAAFDLLKTALTQAPILAYPDFTLPFDLYVDTSDDALGMVLGQVQNGGEAVISYSERKLLPAEKNYSGTKREAVAAVAGIKYLQSYLYGRKFTIHTDHNAVHWLMKIREPTGRLARWALLLQQYDFELVHRSGKSNGNADALSRREYDSLIAALDTKEYKRTELGTYNARIPLLPISLSTWNLITFPGTVKQPRNFSTQLSSIIIMCYGPRTADVAANLLKWCFHWDWKEWCCLALLAGLFHDTMFAAQAPVLDIHVHLRPEIAISKLGIGLVYSEVTASRYIMCIYKNFVP